MKKRFKKIMIWLSIFIIVFLIGWIIVAPHIFTFRMKDEQAEKIFIEKEIPFEFKDLAVEDRNIHYVVTGVDSLPTLVFIHGSPGSWNAFLDYMTDSTLLSHYRMVSVDRPGFGKSGFGNATDLASESRLLLAVIRQIRNGRPVYLAGHSLGGPLVVQMAADDPGLIQGIMLISGSVDPKLEPRENWRKFFSVAPLRYLVPGAFDASNIELMHFKKDVIRLASSFAKVTCPVYLVHGVRDTWVPPANVDYAKKMLINSSQVIVTFLPQGNHFIPWTRKKEIVAELLKMDQHQAKS